MILVTGATGNVGSELVPRLLAAGQAVRVLTRDPAKAARFGDGVPPAIGDLDKPETLASAMDGVQAVYLISQAGQVDGAVAAAMRAGVRHVVRQSTMEAGFDPPLGPGRWHRDAELAIERSGLAWTHLRPGMMTNTTAWWAAGIRATGTVRFPGGNGRLSPVDPGDVAATACAVLTQPGHDGHAYDVTGPQVLTIGEMVAVLADVLGQHVQYVDVPEAELCASMAAAGAARPGRRAGGDTGRHPGGQVRLHSRRTGSPTQQTPLPASPGSRGTPTRRGASSTRKPSGHPSARTCSNPDPWPACATSPLAPAPAGSHQPRRRAAPQRP